MLKSNFGMKKLHRVVQAGVEADSAKYLKLYADFMGHKQMLAI